MRGRHLRLLGIAGVLAALIGCSDDGLSVPSPSDSAQMMAVAMHQLVTKDHTFGGESPFEIFLIEDRTFDVESTPWFERVHTAPTPERPLSVEERTAIGEALDGIGEVRWVEDIQDWYDGVMPTVEGSVLIEIGSPVVDGNTGYVPVSLLCGNVCGTWFTYRLRHSDAGWEVDGIEGSVAIS